MSSGLNKLSDKAKFLYNINTMGIENRELESRVSELKIHVAGNLQFLERNEKAGLIDSEIATALKEHLQAELDYLSDLPPGTSYEEVIDGHFEKADERNEIFDEA